MTLLEAWGSVEKWLPNATVTRFAAAAAGASLLLLVSVTYLLPRFERERALEALIQAEMLKLRGATQSLNALDAGLSNQPGARASSAEPGSAADLRERLIGVQSEFGRIEALLGLAAQTPDYHVRAAMIDNAKDASAKALSASASLSRAAASTPPVPSPSQTQPEPRARGGPSRGAR